MSIKPVPDSKPKGAVPIFGWWLKKLFLVGAFARCPRCEQGELFRSGYSIHKRCPECQVILQPYPGDELGVIAVGYFLTVIPSLLALVAAYFLTDWTGGQLLAFFMLVMTCILFAAYRGIKGIWIAFVYLLTGLKRNP